MAAFLSGVGTGTGIPDGSETKENVKESRGAASRLAELSRRVDLLA